jgi:hypothetical protein
MSLEQPWLSLLSIDCSKIQDVLTRIKSNIFQYTGDLISLTVIYHATAAQLLTESPSDLIELRASVAVRSV